MTQQQKYQHLQWRLGFGPSANGPSEPWSAPEKEWWSKMKNDTNTAPMLHFDVVDTALKGMLMGAGEVTKAEREKRNKEEKRQIREKSKENLKSLNATWLDEMVNSPAQLREKMAFFWHGHFASRNLNVLYQQQLLEIIRTHALGNFKTLLREVSKSAAMLAFLNNQQNKKQHPNENFAREVMELFTVGRGNYTEKDVQEAARAFTGWSFKPDGTFVFRKFTHDAELKTVFGQTGNFEGDDIIDLLLKQHQTAIYIARKFYRFIVNENKVPEDRIEALANVFFESDYDILSLLDAIVTAPWFYDTAQMGQKIKSPIELWVGIRRALPLKVDNENGQIVLQRMLGQVLFYPPNVAGWPGGRNWIDASTLMLRLRIPHIIAGHADLDISPKDDDDIMMGKKGNPLQKKLSMKPDLNAASQPFNQVPVSKLVGVMAASLWQVPITSEKEKVLLEHTDGSDKTTQAKTLLLQLMSTPEYQLC